MSVSFGKENEDDGSKIIPQKMESQSIKNKDKCFSRWSQFVSIINFPTIKDMNIVTK